MKKHLIHFLISAAAFAAGSIIFVVPALADYISHGSSAAIPFWIFQIIMITLLPILCLRTEIKLCEKHNISQQGYNIAFFIGLGLSVVTSGIFTFTTKLGADLSLIWLTLLAGAVWALLSRIVFAAVVNLLNK